MDKRIVDSLWMEATKARSTLEMPDACRVIIYALFIQYLDMENMGTKSPLYDEKFSVGYLALTYGKKAGPQNIGGYVREIEQDIINKKNFVSAEMEKLLGRAEASYVQKVFSIIDEANFEEKKQLYTVAASLIDRLCYAYGSSKGWTSANLSLCKLEGRLLGCKDGMIVYDGFCGWGLSASEAAGGRGTVFLQDIDRSVATIATVMAVLRGNQIGAAECGDSLITPLQHEKYDRIVCEPPFVSKYDSSYLSAVPKDNYIYPETLDSGSLELRHVMAHLGKNGTAVVLVPAGMLFKSGKCATVREKLVEEYIDAVLELPPGVIPNTSTATALLVLKKDKNTNSIYMLNAKDFFEKSDKKHLIISDENINRIVDMYEGRKKTEGVSHDIQKDDVKTRKYNLCTSQYVISNLRDTIVLADTAGYMQKYKQLAGQLATIDKKLESVRGRFIGNV